jgi:hypothetical protein
MDRKAAGPRRTADHPLSGQPGRAGHLGDGAQGIEGRRSHLRRREEAGRGAVRSVSRNEQEVREIQEMVGSRSHISLVYEDDLVDPDAQQMSINRVLDYLTLERVPLSAPIARRRTPLSERVSNWSDIEHVIAATRWAPYLEALEPAPIKRSG